MNTGDPAPPRFCCNSENGRDTEAGRAGTVFRGEGRLTELSTSALRELFALEAGAVVE